MITVYVWPKSVSPPSFGHAAAQIGAGEGNYISWWPGEAGTGGFAGKAHGALSSHRVLKTPAEDAANYKTVAEQIVVNGLDEMAIIQWWAGKRWALADAGRYSFLDQNCAFTVVEALRVGGAEKLLDRLSGTEAVSGWWNSWSTVWSPREVAILARTLNRAAALPA